MTIKEKMYAVEVAIKLNEAVKENSTILFNSLKKEVKQKGCVEIYNTFFLNKTLKDWKN